MHLLFCLSSATHGSKPVAAKRKLDLMKSATPSPLLPPPAVSSDAEPQPSTSSGENTPAAEGQPRNWCIVDMGQLNKLMTAALCFLQEFEGLMVSFDDKLIPVQIFFKLLYSPHYRQTFYLYRGVSLLALRQFPAGIFDRKLLSVMFLQQYCSEPYAGCVRPERELLRHIWQFQDRICS
ncbi:hypothetical protein ACOMHN_052115 [Nucella lapillus]